MDAVVVAVIAANVVVIVVIIVSVFVMDIVIVAADVVDVEGLLLVLFSVCKLSRSLCVLAGSPCLNSLSRPIISKTTDVLLKSYTTGGRNDLRL